MIKKQSTVKVWAIEGPGKEFDEYWFPYGSEKQYQTFGDFAQRWLDDMLDNMDAECDQVTLKLSISTVPKDEAEAVFADQ